MPKSYSRGHQIYYSDFINEWLYSDNNELVMDEDRPCKKCGCTPTIEGYDACTGHIENAKHACCGHGVEPAYSKF